jgi:hypothetical protein
MEVPPEDEVYHLMVLPAEVALRSEVALQMMDGGVAVTGVGAAGGFTVTVTAILVLLAQVLKASA